MAAKCAQLGVKISSLLDRELNELEARRLRSHVEGCADCANEYRELRSARLSARTVPQHEPPADLWGTVNLRLDTVEQQTQALRARTPVRAPLTQTDAFGYALALGVALSLIVGLAIMMFQLHRRSHHHPRLAAAATGPALVRSGSERSLSRAAVPARLQSSTQSPAKSRATSPEKSSTPGSSEPSVEPFVRLPAAPAVTAGR